MKNLLKTALCFAASGLLLSVIQAPFDLSYLAWIALVPLLVGFYWGRGNRNTGFAAFFMLAIFWTVNLYWISYVTVPGWLAFSLFAGVYWVLIWFGLRFCFKKKIPLWLCCGVLFVGAEAWQGIFFQGFDWYLLGHSQYRNLHLIQISDIFGVPGISFIIATVNGLVADIVIARLGTEKANIIKKRIVTGVTVTALLLIGCWFYGEYRIGQTDAETTTGPLIGIVQPNVPSKIKEDQKAAMVILEGLISESQNCIAAGAEFIAWPETMVLGVINQEYLAYLQPDEMPWLLHNKLSGFAAETSSYIMAGSLSVGLTPRDGQMYVTDQYNSAFLYQADGEQSTKRYDKIHLVPFGEYIPLHNYELVKKLMKLFSPYDYDYSLTEGGDHTVFDLVLDGKSYDFASLICYEDTDADLVRKLSFSKENGKKADWLVNISNDGWYVRGEGANVIPSNELPQRTAISVFRAVENRISLFRSVNTGISCLIDPAGRLVDGFESGNLPEKVFERQAVAGWFTDFVPINKKVTFFTKHGSWLEHVCWVLMSAAILAGLLPSNKGTKKKIQKG